MHAWEEWASDIIPKVPGCSLPLMVQELRHAARTFFTRTKAWMTWTDPVNTQANVTSYDIDLPPGTELLQIDNAADQYIPVDLLNWRCSRVDLADQVDLAGVYSTDRMTFNLSGDMDAGVPIKLKLVLIPSLTCAGLPDEQATPFWDALTHGALSRLLLFKDFGFYDTELAGVEGGKFEQAIGEQQIRAYRNFSKTMPRARPKWC